MAAPGAILLPPSSRARRGAILLRAAEVNERLSKISTSWSVLRQAHGGDRGDVTTAQQMLMERYGGAVYRYLLAAVGDTAAAEDLTQEFAVSLVRGEFRGAQPERGRFRNYVKGVLFHLVCRWQKQRQRLPRPVAPGSEAFAGLAAPDDDADRAFNENWRDELLARTWEALAACQPTYHAVLRYRAAHPEVHSAEMATELTRQLGKPLTPDGVRQTLRRARDRFAELLVEEVARSLDSSAADQVEDELRDLGLLEHCRGALPDKRSS
jgi:RNA polymerase sigma-70 factor (ECF subfamily)